MIGLAIWPAQSFLRVLPFGACSGPFEINESILRRFTFIPDLYYPNTWTMKGLILSLGAPNDAAGNLSIMALDRLNAVLQIYRYNPQLMISCTGGKGAHFNEAAHPHYYYAQQYLLANGIPEMALAEPVNSASTIEDFVQARALIYRMEPQLLWVVTSDFHVARAKIIQQENVNYAATIFWGAPSTVPAEQLEALCTHEQKAIARLQQH